MRPRMVAGNWKMHGTITSATALARDVNASLSAGEPFDIAVFPPFVHIAAVASAVGDGPVAFGAQNISDQEAGAFTGEISGQMIRDAGCEYVLIGHSERRQRYGETNELVASKFLAALSANLVPIFCVGETLSQREDGMTERVVAEQLQAVVECAGFNVLKGAVIAYEPVWAIGTGKTAAPEQAEAVHAFLRAQVAQHDPELAGHVRILYGGSVKPDNAKALFEQENIDGGLVGGASLKASDFLAICEAARG